MGKRYVKPGEEVETIGNWSECMMHMRLSDKPIVAMFVEHRADEGHVWYSGRVREPHRTHWISVTTGEAGFYHDDDGHYVSTPDPVPADDVARLAGDFRMPESDDDAIPERMVW